MNHQPSRADWISGDKEEKSIGLLCFLNGWLDEWWCHSWRWDYKEDRYGVDMD